MLMIISLPLKSREAHLWTRLILFKITSSKTSVYGTLVFSTMVRMPLKIELKVYSLEHFCTDVFVLSLFCRSKILYFEQINSSK